MSSGDARARRAVVMSLVFAAAFEVALYASKETPAVYGHAPWLNDPYDTAVSFALFCIPLVGVASALRLVAGHGRPSTPGRLGDLIRACSVALAVIAVTLAACWVAVAARANRPAWNLVSKIQVVALVLISAGAVASAVSLRAAATSRPRHAAGPPGGPNADPDWLGDLIAAGRRIVALAGPARHPARRALDWADARVVPVIRRHAVGSAAVVAAAMGALVAVAQSVSEGYRASVAVVFFAITASGVFAFVVTAGWYLRVVRTDPPGQQQAAVLRATVLAATAVPVALAFRASLWSLVGASPQASGLPALCLLLVAAALTGFTAGLAAERLARGRRERRPR
jgi:hypothetical protein